MEREITGQVDLCDAHGRLDLAARGWSRQPGLRADLRRPWDRRKRWDYWCVMSPDLVVALTYADLDDVGQASVWILERSTGRTATAAVLAPFARGIDLPAQVCTGTQRIERRNLSLEIVEADAATRLSATGRSSRSAGSVPFEVDLVVAKPAGHESLNVVIPWSDRRFQFPSKHNTRPTTGEVRWGDQRWSIGADEPAFAVQDLGRGVWPYANRWNWAAASGSPRTGAPSVCGSAGSGRRARATRRTPCASTVA